MRTRRILRLLVFLVVVVLLCTGLFGCRLYYLFFTVVTLGEIGFTGIPAADIVATFTVDNILVPIEFDQLHLNVGDLEMAFGIRIDVDDNPATGDASGYDVDVSVQYLRHDTTSPGVDLPIAGLIDPPDGQSLFASNPAGTVVTWSADDLHNTIIIFVLADDPVFADFSPNCRTQFYSHYHPLAGPIEDTVADIVGSGALTDAAGDITPGSIDLTSVDIDFTIGGLQ